LLGQLVSQVQQPGQGIGDLYITARAFDLRQAIQRLIQL